MGIEIKDDNLEYLNTVRRLTFLVARSFLAPLHRIKFIYNLTPTKRELTRIAKTMRDFTSKIIEERRVLINELGKENLENLDDNDVGLKKKMCLLDVLLQSTIDDKPLSTEDIQEEVDTFTFAGKFLLLYKIYFIYFSFTFQDTTQRQVQFASHST
jgi:cytochrome P450 family 4